MTTTDIVEQIVECNRRIAVQRKAQLSLQREFEPLQTKMYTIREAISKTIAKRDKLRIEIFPKTVEDIDWRALMKDWSNEDDISMDMWRFYGKVVNEHFGLTTDGVWSDTKERALKFTLDHVKPRDVRIATVKRAVLHFLPVLKRTPAGYIRFGVMSDDLSEHGILELRVSNPHWTSVIMTVYGTENMLLGLVTLDEALDYLDKHHGYNVEMSRP